MAVTENVPLIPLEVLLGNPERMSARISPDGTRLSWLAPDDGVLNVWVQTIGKDDADPVTADRDRGVREYEWAHDNRHLLYVQDEGGDEDWHVHVVDLETGEDADGTPFEGVQAQILANDKRFPDRVLVGLNKDNEQLHDVYRLDLGTRELTKVAENPGVVEWLIDCDLEVRGGVQPTPEGGMNVLLGDGADPSAWELLLAVDPDDALVFGAVTFSLDGRALILDSSIDANAARLVRLDLETRETEVIAEDPQYDVLDALVHPDTREVQMVTFLRARSEHLVLDPAIEGDIEALKRVHPGDLEIVARDHDDAVWLAAFTADDGPISYFSWDRATREATFLFDHRPELKRYTLANVDPFSFTARDGLTVHGYLTFPPGPAREALPTVLNVHGGPWSRDTWGFDPEAQWLANRGYVCVQVNYRGSIGYGKDLLNAGDREWGGKMHDDVIDAARWVIEQGYADPERVAIYGGSYGGYSALVGATFTPDAFCCSVAIVGPSNLKTFIETVPPYWLPMISMMHRRVGNPETDEEFLWSRSPLSRVDQIKIPMLIAHGANDPRVKQAESEQIVAAMKEKGIDHEYILFPDEGHGFAKPENRLKFYAAAERFLARHLGGRSEN